MAFEIRPYPEWSWSKTRDDVFKDCPRMYYYNYYASHNGWLHDSDEFTKTVYRLKQMKNLYLIFGESLHQIAKNSIAEYIENNKLPDKGVLINTIRNNLNTAYKDSKNKSSWIFSPKKQTMLHEMYYYNALPSGRVEEIKGRIESCITNFLNSRSFKEIIHRKNIKIIELDENLNYMTLEENKIFAIIDLLFISDDGKWVVVDWKTGQESDSIEDQLLIYAVYVNKIYNVPFEKIELRIEYLLSGETFVMNVDETKIEKIKDKIFKSIEEMKGYLINPELNIPMTIDKFPVQPGNFKCCQCNYREICEEKYI
ncbi:hypothetical protein Q428_11070 [Fervidicella metallireducens AeB]|uniref:PD-(D/E)XK endonuclease-like domain-containing protein n=1 Tax=Fervidicella metallireducens AeB TaxID=1403537 RepID=A0A017RT45_9CLOT|nr:PD-(D/E)XK nuclease family protein [Fervidicella metallireducens]EYE87847.1 hypothetical protein Q428_11070 [Fervidicella metallireducens AeB]